MPDPDTQGGLQHAALPDVPKLMDDYRRREEALRKQSDEVARLRGEVLIAADREALTIVSNARAEIRRIIVNARRELLGLAAQIQAITWAEQDSGAGTHALHAFPGPGGDEPSSTTDGGRLLTPEAGAQAQDRLLGARHDV